MRLSMPISASKPARPDIPGSLRILPVVLAVSTFVGSAWATDAPKRKHGLWEISTRVEGGPPVAPIQECVDQYSDDVAAEQAKAGAINRSCSLVENEPLPNGIAIHTVCQSQGSTVTTRGVITGSFDTAYQGELRSRFSPPLMGVMHESKVSFDARWLRPCEPGQKPGYVSGVSSYEEMMKSPAVQESLKRRQ